MPDVDEQLAGSMSTWHAAHQTLTVGLVVALASLNLNMPLASARQQTSALVWAMGRSTPRATLAAPAISETLAPWVRIGIGASGLYELTCADLAAAGVDITHLDPGTLKVYTGRGVNEVAADVSSGVDSRCDPAITIRFYAQQAYTLYTDTNIYWLTYGGGPGKRLTQRAVTPPGVEATQPASFLRSERFEQDLIYNSLVPTAEGADHWFWSVNSLEQRFALPTLASLAATSATLQVELQGYSPGSHTTQVSLNGRLLTPMASYTGREVAVLNLSFPQDLLNAVTNTLTIQELGPQSDQIFIDACTLTYSSVFAVSGDALLFDEPLSGIAPQAKRYEVGGLSGQGVKVFDVTDSADAVWLLDTHVAEQAAAPYTLTFTDTATAAVRYLVVGLGGVRAPLSLTLAPSTDLHNQANGADYIVIAHSSLITSIQPLAAFRASQGLRVKVVDVQSVYDEFSGGLPDPQAIRDFLYHATTHWQSPAPAYVLLVGSGHLDFRHVYDTYGATKPNLIPPFMRMVDPYIGQAASDNYYVAFSPTSTLPSLAIGRLPAQDAASASAAVAKIIDYERLPAPGAWRDQVAFVADNAYQADGTPDSAGNFWASSDNLISNPAILPPPFQAERIYYNPCLPLTNPTCALSYLTYPTVDATRNAITSALQSGRLIVNYVGHAGVTYWAHEQLLREEDVSGLANAGRHPLILAMTCYDGMFANPLLNSLAEVNVLAPGGALASWSASGQGVGSGHDLLDRGFFDAVLRQGVYRIGQATVAAKTYLWQNGDPAYRDLIDTFNLLGDPASRLSVGMWLSTTLASGYPVTPGSIVTSVATLVNLGPFLADGAQVRYALPPDLRDTQLMGASVPVTPVIGPDGPAFDVGTLAVGDRVALTLTATLSATLLDALPFTIVLTSTASSLVEALTPQPDTVTRVDVITASLDGLPAVAYLPLVIR